MRKILRFNKILTACFVLGILFVCMAFTAKPALAAATPTYIANIGITQKGSASSAKSALSGHTIIDRDLNEGADGDYVYMGYKTTTDPYKAITGIVFRVGNNPPASLYYNKHTFYLVGGSDETNTASGGGYIDLNAKAGGDYIYMYVTRDHGYGAPLTTMTVNESKSYSGYSTGTNTSGSVIDLNQDAGGKYLYLHYKRYSATVTINYYHLNDAGEVVVTQVSGTVSHHLEEMKKKPSVPGLVTYDEKPLRKISWREDPSIENQGTSLVSSPSATVATSGKSYYATYGFLTDTLAIYPDTIIRFDANGGSGAPSELRQKDRRDVTAGKSSLIMGKLDFTIPDNTCTKDGTCKFLGWSTDKNATKATYAPGQSISVDRNTTLYAVYEPTNYVNGICTYCGKVQPGSVAVLSKNGKNVFANASLDVVITEAEKCAAADKAVVTILQSMDLGSTAQRIESGVFTLDLNGFEIKGSYNDGVLYLDGASVHVTLRDSGETGKITGIYRGINVQNGSTLTMSGGTITATSIDGDGVYLSDSSTAIISGGTITATSSSDGVYLSDSSTAIISGGTITADGYGVYVAENSTATISGGTINSRQYGVRVGSSSRATISGGGITGNFAVHVNGSTATISGGSFSGKTYDIYLSSASLRLSLGQDGTGATFPGGFSTGYNGQWSFVALNDMLDAGCAYWAGNTMMQPADDATAIKDKGDITIKAACTHGSFTKKNYVNNNSNHTYTRSCCNTTVAEDHSYTDCMCICGASSHSFDQNGFCSFVEGQIHYQPAKDANADGYYEIGNAGQLFWFAQQVNVHGNREIKGVLTDDIDLEGRPWTPIGATGEGNNNFRGHFNGQGHSIKGLNVNANRAGSGFFGEVRLGTAENFSIRGTVTVTTSNITYVGGVIGSAPGANSNQPNHNGATIRNITSYVKVTVEDDKTGVGRIGGFIGYANHETLIENCAWRGTIDLGNQAMTLGAGGFIGRINENSAVTIRNCAAYGSIVNDGVTENVGAFMGLASTGSNTVMKNCLFAGSVTGAKASSVPPFGTWKGASKTLTNSYYIDTLQLEDADATAVTEDQLASGEVAYLLGDAWGQTIGTKNVPVLGGAKVYQVTDCGGNTIYRNVNENDTEHTNVGGVCSVCGANLCDHSGNENMRTDCTVALNCSVCGGLLTEAAAAHIPGEDDNDCTTAVKCVNCDQITVEAKDHTPGEDDGDCTTAVKCVNCDKNAVEAKDHMPAEDDGDCTTAVKCMNCDKNAVEAKDEHVHGENGQCAFCGQKVFAIINGKAYLIKGDVTHTGLDIDAGSYHNECYKAGDGYVALESDGVFSGSFTAITLYNATIDVRGNEAERAISIAGESVYISFFGENHLWADEVVLWSSPGNGVYPIAVAGAEDAVLNLHGNVSAIEISVDSGTVRVYGVDAEDSFAVDVSDRLKISEGALLTVISGDSGIGLNSGIAARKGIEAEGTLNAIVLTASEDDSNILYELTAYGDAVLGGNTFNLYYGMEFPEGEKYIVNFHVPAGTSVTIPEGITLNLDTFDQVVMDGELIVKGTVICSHNRGLNAEEKCTACGVLLHTHSYVANGFCRCGSYQPAEPVDGYYQIGSAGQLYWFAEEVNGGNTAINGKLTADIVVNEDVLQADGNLNGDESNFRAWTPIGDSANLYAGTFDGQNHTISGLYFSGSRSAGLFGETVGCVIKNVAVADSYFYVAWNGTVGGIVGVAGSGACLANCHNAGTVIGRSAVLIAAGGIVGRTDVGSMITDCSNSGKISGYTTGGITADSYGTITNCFNTGTISGFFWLGGIVGTNRGTVEYCYNTGLYDINPNVSDIAGTNDNGTIRNCYSTNTGIVAYKDQIGTIENCYYLNGEADGASIVKTAEQFASGEVAFLLGEPFGQTIGTDETPILGGAKVYQVTDCLGRTIYSNVNESYTEHSYVDGRCEICGIFHESMWMTLPAALKTIEDEAFIGTAAVQIILPDGCETIGVRAFANSASLQYVYMPDSVTDIAENAFEGSDNVTFICESANAAAAYADSHNIPCIIK